MRDARLDLEAHRPALTGHCYRMLGSPSDADDAVQETMVRAWRALERFDGRSSLRTWLYRIATNVCLDALSDRRRRARPMEREPGTVLDELVPQPRAYWIEPVPDARVLPADADPAELAVLRESIRLAFVAALQELPPRQRAALLLTEVLGWSAKETAAQLDSSVESVKSALKRARSILRAQLPRQRLGWSPPRAPTVSERELLQRFMDAHDRTDATAFAKLLSDDVRMTMPPLPYWFAGRDAVAAFAAQAFGPGSPLSGGHWRGVITGANLQPALAGYLLRPGEREYRAQALNVLRIEHGQIAEITVFEPRLFAAFGLPPVWPADGAPFSKPSPSQ